MVVPIRDIGNKFFLSSANMNLQQTITLPTVSLSTNTGMDILFRNISDNYNKVRDRTFFSNPQSSRTSLMSSSKSLVIYYVRMKNNNDLEDNIGIEPINSSQLSYMTLKEQVNQVSMMADSINSMMDQYVLIEGPALNSTITSSPLMLMRITLLTFNYYMTPTGLWNLICGMVISTLFHYTGYLNTLYLMLTVLGNL